MSHDYIYGCDVLIEDGELGEIESEVKGLDQNSDVSDVERELGMRIPLDDSDYVRGCDILGETVVRTIPKAGVYVDKATVLSVQRALKEAGYDPGPLDGVFGPKTSAAISALQSAHGITPTGQVDYSVVMALKEYGVSPLAPPVAVADAAPSPSLSPAAAASMTAPVTGKPVGLLQRPVWQLALGGVGLAAVFFGMIGLVARR